MSEITLRSVFFSSCSMSEKLHLLSLLSRMKAVNDFEIVKFLLDAFNKEQAEELCIHLIEYYGLPYEKKQSETVVEDDTLEAEADSSSSESFVPSPEVKVENEETPESDLTASTKAEHKRGRPKGSRNKSKSAPLPEQNEQKERAPSSKNSMAPENVEKPAKKTVETVAKMAEETMNADELIARDKIGDKLAYSLLYSYAIGVNKSRLIRSDYRLSFATCVGIFVPYAKCFTQQGKCEEFILDIEEAKVTLGTLYKKVCSIAACSRPKYQDNIWSALTESQMVSIKPIVNEINEILRKVGGDVFQFHYNVGKYACPSVKDKHRYSCDVL